MLTVIVSIVISMLLVGAAIYAIQAGRKKAKFKTLSKMLNDYRFESSDRRVRFYVKNHVLQYIYVGGNPYDSFEEALARESFTKKDHGIITVVQYTLDKERKRIYKDMVHPEIFREFKNTPAGDLRIYNEGPVKLSPRFTIIIGTNHEGNVEIGRAFLAKEDLLADNLHHDFKLVAVADKVTKDEASEHVAGFITKFLSNEEYSKEIAKYQEVSDAIELYNKHRKDFTIQRGKMVWHGKAVIPERQALPEPTVSTVDPEREEVDRLILSARSHK